YFPPEPKFGKPSFKNVLNSVLEIYKNKRDDLEKLKAEITNFFEKNFINTNYSDEINYDKLKDAYQVIVNNYDWKNGGWGKSPKFPMFPLLNFLIDYYLVFKDENSNKIVKHNLFKILTGGIYDHIGGGMHRYTIDNQWIIPHFEKMLYDNAQLIQTIAKYLIIDDNNFFKTKLYETFNFIKSELKLENGGYLTAIDADSEGEEGKFYLWNYYELVDTIEEKFDKELFFAYYQFNLIEKDKFLGNISIRKIPDQNDSILLNELSLVQLHLGQYRKKKIPPEKDNKILTDLNSLLISALTFAFRATEDQKFVNEAISIFDFIQKNLLKQNKLFHSYTEGDTKIEGFADDYFNFIQAMVDLYEVTFDEKYLYQAYEILNNSIGLFYDGNKKVIYQQTENSLLPIRTIENNDYSKPSSTALAISLLFKIGKLFEEKTFISIAQELLHKNFNDAIQNPFGRGKFLSTFLNMVSPDAQLILVEGDNNTSFDKFKSFLFRKISPIQLTLLKKKDSSFNFSYLQDKKPHENKLTLYVCENFTCQRPLNNPDQLNF
ncbi:MAG: thioredoxin domain-containing protein, partial [Ignavibacteria bacterium]